MSKESTSIPSQTKDLNANTYWNIHEARYTFLQEYLGHHILTGAAVLDVGCYPPFLLDWLEKHAMNAFGIASQHESVSRKQVKILNIDFDRFPWKDHMFDAVIFTEVLEHLPFSPMHALVEMHRVLKPGGLLILSTPNTTKLQHRLKLLVGKSTVFPLEQLLATKPNDNSIYHRHNREYTKQEVETILEKAGFVLQHASYEIFYPPTRKKVQQESFVMQTVKWLGFIPQVLYPPFRDSLFVVAKA